MYKIKFREIHLIDYFIQIVVFAQNIEQNFYKIKFILITHLKKFKVIIFNLFYNMRRLDNKNSYLLLHL